ncbi:MAG: outer membrane protein assembly factor BamA [Alistipes sp.]|nr:outer membrane protein assembly factor BamA [Alistipes sp.]
MNYLRNILVLAVALVSLFGTASAQEAVAESTDSTKVESYFDENAPMFRTEGGKQQQYYIRKVNVRGLEHLDPDLVKASAGLVDGDSILLPSNFISNVITRLWSQRYFADVKVGAEIEGDSLDLEVFLKERPRVFNWEFEGITTGKKKDIMDKLKLRRNSELSDYVLDKNVRLIKEYWSEKGFRNAKVNYRIEQDSVRAQYANVIFEIDRGERVKIGKINFEGNEVFDDKRLRRTFKKTHQKSINFFKGTRLKDKEYEEDKDLLIDFYNSKGYRNAHILLDSIYEYEPNRLAIDLKVSEGNKYYIRNIDWVGNSIYSTDQLQNMFAVKTGDTYDKKSMHKRLGIGKEENPEDMSIKSLYQNSGYLMSQIEPSETIIGTDSIDLEIKIFEGKQFTINEVGITGNMRVDDEVIRRELYTRPGELYDRSMLMQTIRMLGSMGHFNPEAIMPDIKPVSNELVDVNWPLEEQASDQFNIAGGWGSGTFVGSIGVTFNNLSIKNALKKGAWRPYPMGQNQRLSINGQTNGTYYKALSLSFTDPWLGGKKPNSFTISGHISEQNNAYYVWQTSTMHFRTYGLALGLGKRMNWPDPYFTFYGEASYERYDLKNWSSFIMRNGAANMLSLKLVLSRNSVDQPIYPRRGSEITFSVQATQVISV